MASYKIKNKANSTLRRSAGIPAKKTNNLLTKTIAFSGNDKPIVSRSQNGSTVQYNKLKKVNESNISNERNKRCSKLSISLCDTTQNCVWVWDVVNVEGHCAYGTF